MRVAITGPAIGLICLGLLKIFDFLLCWVRLPVAPAPKVCSDLGFIASFPFLLVSFSRQLMEMIDNSWENTFLQLRAASRNVLPLYYGPLGPRSHKTSIRHGVQRMSDYGHRSVADLFGHTTQPSLYGEQFDVQSPMKPRILRFAVNRKPPFLSIIQHRGHIQQCIEI